MDDKILEAIPWRCFHCDFITTDRSEAAAHFGERDDAEEFTPICKWWANMPPEERAETLQDTLRQLNAERDVNERATNKIDALEYQVNSQESCIRSYKPFRQCRTIHDVFCLYDSMEGRALAAEEAIRLASPPSRGDAKQFIESRLVAPLLHGDEQHQQWLREELRKWIPDLQTVLG